MADSTTPDPRGEARTSLRGMADDEIRRPLWKWPPAWALAVIHERRRRFGWDDDEGLGNG
jgi:hypothetical protein